MEIAALHTALTESGISVENLKTLYETVSAFPAVPSPLPPASASPETEVERQFPVYVLPLPVEEMLTTWRKLHDRLPRIGWYPEILGDEDSLKRYYPLWEYATAPTDYLRQAEQIDVRQWLDEQREETLRFAEADDDLTEAEWNRLPLTRSPIRVETWLHNALFRHQPKPVQYLGFVATAHSWEVPAFLAYGNWNECPNPAEQVALHRYWYMRYQQEIVAALYDVIMCQPARHPADKDEALALAGEQMIYCYDIVAQGTGTLKRLAMELIQQPIWFFWWD